MTLAKAQVKWSVILMNRLGPDIFPTLRIKTCYFASCACAFKSSGYSFLEVKFGQSLKKNRNWINQPGGTITCRPVYPILHWTDHESDYSDEKRLSSWSSSGSGKPILMCRVPDVGLCTNVKFLILRFDWRASNQSNYTITSCSWANGVTQNAWDWLQAISFSPHPLPLLVHSSARFPTSYSPLARLFDLSTRKR